MPRLNAVTEIRLCGQRSFILKALANNGSEITDLAEVFMPRLNAVAELCLCGQRSFLLLLNRI